MLNAGTSGAAFQSIVTTGIQMAVISAVAGLGAIAGGYACATLTAQVAKDMRQAIYTKSLKLSVYDFRQFGTASITTRTISDVTTIQMALLSSIQMILPVPVICVLSLVLTFNLNRAIGFVLLAVVLVVLILAFFMIRSASPLFRRLQKLLDRMSTVFLENLTGVRVVRAFNNEKRGENPYGHRLHQLRTDLYPGQSALCQLGRPVLLLYQLLRGSDLLDERRADPRRPVPDR